MRLQEITFSSEYSKGPDIIVADVLSRIPWPVLPREPNAAEHAFDGDTDSEFELNAALTIIDVALPTINELPPLTIEEIAVQQRRHYTLLFPRTWIEKALRLTALELEGQPEAIRNGPLCENNYSFEKIYWEK